MKISHFWGIYAKSYDQIWDAPVMSAVRASVHVELADARAVIDLGCGTGLMSEGLVESGVRVTGVDNAPSMLERALARGRVSRVLLCDADKVPLTGGTADAVLIGNLLHLHPHPAAVLDEARRLLRQGGVIVATWPVPALSAAAMYRADRDSGRAALPSMRANALRLGVGLAAGRTSGLLAARATGAHDTGSLLGVLGLDASQPVFTVANCQQVLVLRTLR